MEGPTSHFVHCFGELSGFGFVLEKGGGEGGGTKGGLGIY